MRSLERILGAVAVTAAAVAGVALLVAACHSGPDTGAAVPGCDDIPVYPAP